MTHTVLPTGAPKLSFSPSPFVVLETMTTQVTATATATTATTTATTMSLVDRDARGKNIL
jgi:hypothetical protein